VCSMGFFQLLLDVGKILLRWEVEEVGYLCELLRGHLEKRQVDHFCCYQKLFGDVLPFLQRCGRLLLL